MVSPFGTWLLESTPQKSENARLEGWLDNIYGVLYDLDGYNPDNAKQMAGLCNDVLMMVKKAMRGEPSRPSLEEAERQLKEEGKDD